mgnify:CR=1 FL=1
MKVELKFRENDARAIQVFLANRYGKRRSTKLETLIMIAVHREVALQAQIELDIDGLLNDHRQIPE